VILPAIMFYLFSAVAIASGVMVVSARNPVHSVLFLILAFFNAAGLFVLMGAEFLAMILVIVYVGAVAVLFLFVVMMLDIDFAQLRTGAMKYLPVGALVGFILVAELIFVFGSWAIAPGVAGVAAAPLPTASGFNNTRALVLTLRHRVGTRRQDVAEQLARQRSETVEVVKVPVGAGAAE
jgi:NADH-quinone oxidoreductase subunit J